MWTQLKDSSRTVSKVRAPLDAETKYTFAGESIEVSNEVLGKFHILHIAFMSEYEMTYKCVYLCLI